MFERVVLFTISYIVCLIWLFVLRRKRSIRTWRAIKMNSTHKTKTQNQFDVSLVSFSSTKIQPTRLLQSTCLATWGKSGFFPRKGCRLFVSGRTRDAVDLKQLCEKLARVRSRSRRHKTKWFLNTRMYAQQCDPVDRPTATRIISLTSESLGGLGDTESIFVGSCQSRPAYTYAVYTECYRVSASQKRRKCIYCTFIFILSVLKVFNFRVPSRLRSKVTCSSPANQKCRAVGTLGYVDYLCFRNFSRVWKKLPGLREWCTRLKWEE